MLKLCLVALAIIVSDGRAQEDEEEPYRGKLIGKFNSYHHQVSGSVYAVDEWTLLLVEFNYDGTGEDAFFWAGDAPRPGPHGFIVPDEHNKTNVLERYYNAEVVLRLPEGKRVSRLKWLAVHDVSSQNTFADVFLPEDFAPPAPQRIGPLVGASHVTSAPVVILDSQTLLIPELRYDGSGQETYWWAGVGPQPGAKGWRVPDEDGYLEPLGAYKGADVRLSLGAAGVAGAHWLALWDQQEARALGSVLLPQGANVPPARADTLKYRSSLPSCRQLHRDLQVAWEVFGSQITIQLAGVIGASEYMAFGVSGSGDAPRMVGGDALVARFDAATQRPLATDYNITDYAPCVQVLGAWRGVCRDTLVGGLDSNQPLSGSREGPLTTVTLRRTLKPDEPMDREWPTEGLVQVMWAVGQLQPEAGAGAGSGGGLMEPAFHRLWGKAPIALNLSQHGSDCVPFTTVARPAPPQWERAQLFDPALRAFSFALGPRGALGPPALAWYVNGQLAPDLQLRRGLQYTFKVFGGSDPHSATQYHPLVVTAEPLGGLERLSPADQRGVRLLAGAHVTRRGHLTPTAAGPLCVGAHPPGADRRRDAAFASFRAYNRSLLWRCEPGAPAQLLVAPNASWPDLVYYHSFTHTGMGGRIFIVDRHQRKLSRAASAAPAAAAGASVALLLAAAAAAVATRL